MRIWFQKHAVTGRVPGLDAAYRAHVDRVVRPGTTVDFHGLPAGTYDAPLPAALVRHGGVEDLFAGWFGVQAVRAERAGSDAYVIGTSQDPGLAMARALVEIPVLGYGETVMHLAAMLADRFAFVGFIPELEEPLRANAARYGVAGRLSGCAYTDVGPDEVHAALQGDAGAFLDAFRAAARRAIAGGAQLLVPGEGLPNEILVREGVTEIDGVGVLDPDGLVVTTAELLVTARRHGMAGPVRTGYRHARPTREQLDHLLALYAPAAWPGPDAGEG